MLVTMIPYDAFRIVRIGTYNGDHGEEIEPPYEDGEPRKNWQILAIDCAQSTTVEAEDDDSTPVPTVDRSVFVLWGLLKTNKPSGSSETPAKPDAKTAAKTVESPQVSKEEDKEATSEEQEEAPDSE